MAKRRSGQDTGSKTAPGDDAPALEATAPRSVDLDSAGVYYMSIEDFERRIEPVVARVDARERGEGEEGEEGG